MPSPFPGMDPYLEDPKLWPDVHAALVPAIRDALVPALRPRYVARVEQLSYSPTGGDWGDELKIIPDVRVLRRRPSTDDAGRGTATLAPPTKAVTDPIDITPDLAKRLRHRFIEIRDAETGEVVTIIELLSPSNKRPGSGAYDGIHKKRDAVFGSGTNWVEIDLLRAGERLTESSLLPDTVDYQVVVARNAGQGQEEQGQAGHRVLAWPVRVDQPLPTVAIPLRGDDPDVPLDLQAVLSGVYDRAAYDLSIDYLKPPPEPRDERLTSLWIDLTTRRA